MAFAFVIVIFAMSILFNVFLPSGDVYSDFGLMINILTFNIGDSLELASCRSCYGKTEDEVYKLKNRSCEQCLKNRSYFCGRSAQFLDKLNELQNSKKCQDEAWKLAQFNGWEYRLENGECDGSNPCCAKNRNKLPNNQSFLPIDRRISISRPWSNPACNDSSEIFYNFFVLSGSSKIDPCQSIFSSNRVKQQVCNRINILRNGPTFIEKSFKMKRVLDADVVLEDTFKFEDGCGVYVLPRHYINSGLIIPVEVGIRNPCGDDVCLVHLRTLHARTNIYDLQSWKTKMDVMDGGNGGLVRVGGERCGLIRVYGLTLLIPILLNLGFNIVVFLRDLRKGDTKKWEIIPVLCLFYPQWKTLKFLGNYVINHRDETRLKMDITEFDQDIGSLEPFVESALQVLNFAIFVLLNIIK